MSRRDPEKIRREERHWRGSGGTRHRFQSRVGGSLGRLAGAESGFTKTAGLERAECLVTSNACRPKGMTRCP